MEEIAQQFHKELEEIAQQLREELQELIDRYKTRLFAPRIMHIAQDVLHKTLSNEYCKESE